MAAKTENVRWCINTKTGNIKHWNPLIEGVENIVECNAEGVPLSMIDYFTSQVAKQATQEAKSKAKAEATALTNSSTSMVDGLVSEVAQTMTKKQLADQAEGLNIPFTETDVKKEPKEWFARKILIAQGVISE